MESEPSELSQPDLPHLIRLVWGRHDGVVNCRNEGAWQLVEDLPADDVNHQLGLVSLKQVRQLAIVLPLQVVHCLVDGRKVLGKQLTNPSCGFDLAEEDLGEEESLEAIPSPVRDVQSSHQVVVENP